MPYISIEPEGVKLISPLNPNEAAGPDRISSRMLNELADELYIYPLAHFWKTP